MRRILTVGMAGLLAFTVTTTPLSAADLGMPTKAPIITKAPPMVEEVTYWPYLLIFLAAVGAGLGACFATCDCLGSCPSCSTNPCPD